VRFDTAQTYIQAAKVELALGKPIVREHTEQAEKLLRALIAENPANPDYQVELASCLNLVAAFGPTPEKQFSQAEARCREAIRLCETVQQMQPDIAPGLYELADAHRSLGNLYLEANRFGEAEHHYTAARDLGERLVRAHPEQPSYRNALAEFYSRLGHVTIGEVGDQHFRRAEEQFQRLIDQYPQELSYKVRLGAVYNNWGALWREKRPEAALELYARGIHLMEPVHRQEPQYAVARLCLRNLHGSRARALAGLKRFRDTLPDWDEVVKLADESSRLGCRAERANYLALVGEHGRAVAEACAVAGDKESSPEALLLAAFACAQS
jgi:tetratricopeptide (TPR) repeat protein